MGVMPVSAVLLAAISASTRISGSASAPRTQLTPNQACSIQTPIAPNTGTPIQESTSGSSMSRSRSCCPGAFLRRRRLLNAATKISGFANRATSEATTIIVMPYQSAQLLRMCARPKIAVPAAIEPSRGWISPSEIMIGATTTKLSSAPSSRLDATRIPMRPPAPIIAKSSPGDSASWRISTPASFGSGAYPFSTSQ